MNALTALQKKNLAEEDKRANQSLSEAALKWREKQAAKAKQKGQPKK